MYQMHQCPRCGWQNYAGQRFCEGCGMVLAAVCPKCGAAVNPAAKFCGNCGAQIDDSEQQQKGWEQVPGNIQQTEPLAGGGWETNQGDVGMSQQSPGGQRSKNQWLMISLVLVVAALLIGGGIYAMNSFSGSPASETPPPAVPLASDNNTSTEDKTPPDVSEILSDNVTALSAVITWMTDEPSSSQVEYGIDTYYGKTTELDNALVIEHSVSLSDLKPETTYHLRVRSKDGLGQQTISGDYVFTTLDLLQSAKLEVFQHYMATEVYGEAVINLVRGRVKNNSDFAVPATDVVILVKYKKLSGDGEVYNATGSVKPKMPAAFRPGEIRDFEVLLNYEAEEDYEISVTLELD